MSRSRFVLDPPVEPGEERLREIEEEVFASMGLPVFPRLPYVRENGKTIRYRSVEDLDV